MRWPQLQAERLLLLHAAVLLLFHVDSPARGPLPAPFDWLVNPAVDGSARGGTEKEPRRAHGVDVILAGTRATERGALTEADRTTVSRLDTTVHTGGVGATAATGGTARGAVEVGVPLTCRGAAASAYHRAKRSSEMERPAIRSVSLVMPSSGAGGGGVNSALSACESMTEDPSLTSAGGLVMRVDGDQGWDGQAA